MSYKYSAEGKEHCKDSNNEVKLEFERCVILLEEWKPNPFSSLVFIVIRCEVCSKKVQ